MPGAGSIDVRSAQLRLVDGLLALYHGAAIKHAEKVIFKYISSTIVYRRIFGPAWFVIEDVQMQECGNVHH